MRTDPEGDRHPARRGDLFIVGSIGSGATLASSSGNDVLPVVLGASTLVLLACLGIPPRGGGRACGWSPGTPGSGFSPFPGLRFRRVTKSITASGRYIGAPFSYQTRLSARSGRERHYSLKRLPLDGTCSDFLRFLVEGVWPDPLG